MTGRSGRSRSGVTRLTRSWPQSSAASGVMRKKTTLVSSWFILDPVMGRLFLTADWGCLLLSAAGCMTSPGRCLVLGGSDSTEKSMAGQRKTSTRSKTPAKLRTGSRCNRDSGTNTGSSEIRVSIQDEVRQRFESGLRQIVQDVQAIGTELSAGTADTPTFRVNVRQANAFLKFIDHEFIPYYEEYEPLHEMRKELQKWIDSLQP